MLPSWDTPRPGTDRHRVERPGTLTLISVLLGAGGGGWPRPSLRLHCSTTSLSAWPSFLPSPPRPSSPLPSPVMILRALPPACWSTSEPVSQGIQPMTVIISILKKEKLNILDGNYPKRDGQWLELRFNGGYSTVNCARAAGRGKMNEVPMRWAHHAMSNANTNTATPAWPPTEAPGLGMRMKKRE